MVSIPFAAPYEAPPRPDHRVVGISKLARLVDIQGKRMQIQERVTIQIADTLNDVLQPKGVAVVIEGSHPYMTHAWHAQAPHGRGDQPHAGRLPLGWLDPAASFRR